jgi:hypothetical protein
MQEREQTFKNSNLYNIQNKEQGKEPSNQRKRQEKLDGMNCAMTKGFRGSKGLPLEAFCTGQLQQVTTSHVSFQYLLLHVLQAL